MRKIEAHPDAAIFPMMSADELADLAADIKENGQRFPIVIGPYEGREVIIDGRNRYEACEIAGVEPKFEKLNGHDPKAFILSANVNRRHMTRQQKTMAVALLYPEPRVLKRKADVVPGQHQPDRGELAKARAVLAYSHALASSVLEGTKPLRDAYNEARLAQGKVTNETILLRQLRDRRPDLAERVVQGEATLGEAVAAEKAEADAAKQRRWAATKNLVEGVQLLDREVMTATDLLDDFDPSVAQQMGETITPERLARVAQFSTALAQLLSERKAS